MGLRWLVDMQTDDDPRPPLWDDADLAALVTLVAGFLLAVAYVWVVSL